MIDYKSLRVDEIKRMIIEEGHCTEQQLEELDIKGKSGWVSLHQRFNNITPEPTSRFVFEEPTEDQVSTDKPQPRTEPRYCDPGWQAYVMSKFEPNECVTINDNQYPTVNGLRRVVELLLGEIMWSGPIEVRSNLDPQGLSMAVVTYEIAIAWKLDAGPYIDLASDKDIFPVKKFRAVASSNQINTDDAYAVFPEAIAETRAEGRALRRALRLGIVCADELTRKDTASIVKAKVAQAEKPTEGNWDENAPITDNQVNSIKLLCERLGIDIAKFINSGSKTYADIMDVSKQTAANMIKRLNQYQNNTGLEVPTDILLEKTL